MNKGGNPALLGAIDGIDELSAARLGIAPTPALPTPLVADAHTLHDTRLARDRAVAGLMNVLNEIPLLPTPAVNDMGDNKTVDWWDDFTEETERRLHNGNGHGPSLAIEMRRLPTPKATNNENAPGPDPAYHGGLGWQMKQRAVSEQSWGPYAAAVARWEALTRPVPAPTIWNEEKARADLSPYFVEWMMGVPEGWVTDPEIWDDYRDARGRLGSAQYVRKAQLHALGNGVCPPQAAAALRGLLGLEVEPWRDGLRVVA